MLCLLHSKHVLGTWKQMGERAHIKPQLMAYSGFKLWCCVMVMVTDAVNLLIKCQMIFSEGKQSPRRYASRTQKLKLNSVKCVYISDSAAHTDWTIKFTWSFFWWLFSFFMSSIKFSLWKSTPLSSSWRRVSRQELAHFQHSLPVLSVFQWTKPALPLPLRVLPLSIVVSYIASTSADPRPKIVKS